MGSFPAAIIWAYFFQRLAKPDDVVSVFHHCGYLGWAGVVSVLADPLRLRVANFSALVFGNKAGQCRIGTCTEGSCSETWPAAHNVQALVRLIWEHELISPLDASLEIYRPHPSNTQQIEFRFVELFLLRASAMAVLCFLAIAVEESWE